MLGLKASPAFWREAYAALAFSAVLLNNGAAIGWSSPALPSLKEEEEWVRQFDKDPYSEGWAGAVLCLTSVLGNGATPSLVAWMGPKLVLVTVCLPLFTLNWLGLVLARFFPSLALLLLARALSGVAVGVSISTVPSYIIAISSQRNQGLLALLPQFMTSLALLAVYLVGALVDWWWLSLSLLAMQPPLLLLLLLVPDSPSSLVARGKTAAARSALLWLRSPAPEEGLQELQGVKSEQGDGLWLTLGKMGKPSNYRPMMASISLLSGLQLSGVSPLVFYSVKFFTLAGASTSPSVCSIIVASITLVTMVAVVMFGTTASRKNMLLISQVGLTACLFTLSGYFFADLYDSADSIRWLPLAILVLYFIFFNIGLSSYVWVITAEILPEDIRSQMVPLAILISSILWFFVTFFFQAMFEAMGGFYIFLFYSFCSLFFIFTTSLFIPQTNGKSQEEIALFYSKYSPPCSTGP